MAKTLTEKELKRMRQKTKHILFTKTEFGFVSTIKAVDIKKYEVAVFDIRYVKDIVIVVESKSKAVVRKYHSIWVDNLLFYPPAYLENVSSSPYDTHGFGKKFHIINQSTRQIRKEKIEEIFKDERTN